MLPALAFSHVQCQQACLILQWKIWLYIIVDFAPQMGWKWDFLAYALGVGLLVMELVHKPLFAGSKCLFVLQDWINKGGQDVT